MSEPLQKKHIQRRVLLVSGLPALTTEEMIKEHFSKFGALYSVQLITDPDTKEPRGFAYITLEDSRDTAHVLSSEHKILQRTLQVELPSKKGYRRVLLSQVTHKRLYLYGLPNLTDSDDLTEAFKGFGKIVAARVVINPKTKILQSFGCVDFETPEMAQKALLKPVYVRGSMIEVTLTRKPGVGVSVNNRERDPDSQKAKKFKKISKYFAELPTKSALEEEVSNYQCLGLNPSVRLNIGTVPLIEAFDYGWFDLEQVIPLSKAPGRKEELKKLKILQADKPEASQEEQQESELKKPQSIQKQLKIPHTLRTDLDQQVSNYSFRVEKPQVFLGRSLIGTNTYTGSEGFDDSFLHGFGELDYSVAKETNQPQATVSGSNSIDGSGDSSQ